MKEIIGQNWSEADPLLSVEKLSRQIEGKWIWQDMNFHLSAGDRIAVVGPSGSGKTLLLRAIAGLDPIQFGEIKFRGRPLSNWEMPRYRAQVIYLHQRPALLEGTVAENLQYVYRFQVHQQKTLADFPILEYLTILGRSSDFLQRPSSALSGGEAQIVAFLRALQLSPAILLLDEPTASLDAETTKSLETLISIWQQEDPQRVYLWTSHDSTQLERVTTRKIQIPSF